MPVEVSIDDDLRRFLAGEPVEARPVGQFERVWRWTRRNWRVASLLLLIALSLLFGSITSTWFAIVASRQAQQALAAKERADVKAEEAERERADQQRLRSEWLLYAWQIPHAQRQWQDGNLSEANVLLDACRRDLRGWEYDYLYTLCNQQQLTLEGHNSFVTSVVFSPDGERIVGGSTDGCIEDWDAGQEPLTINAFTSFEGLEGFEGFSDFNRFMSGSCCIMFSPDGKRIASASADRTIKIWNASNSRTK